MMSRPADFRCPSPSDVETPPPMTTQKPQLSFRVHGCGVGGRGAHQTKGAQESVRPYFHSPSAALPQPLTTTTTTEAAPRVGPLPTRGGRSRSRSRHTSQWAALGCCSARSRSCRRRRRRRRRHGRPWQPCWRCRCWWWCRSLLGQVCAACSTRPPKACSRALRRRIYRQCRTMVHHLTLLLVLSWS